MIEWIDSVRSLANQAAKVRARATANPAVESTSGTPRLSFRLSVIRVPTTLMKTTASQ